MDYEKIGKRIKALREAAQPALTIKRLANDLFTSDQTIRNWEAGERLTLQGIEKVAKYFKVTEAFLIFGPAANASPVANLVQSAKGRISQIAWIQQMCEDIHEKRLGQMIDLFAKLSPEFQDRVLSETNFLVAIEYPIPTSSNPFGGQFVDILKRALARAEGKKK